MAAVTPERVRIRMYQVGFGDCFLLSFDYAEPIRGRSSRHVLIDFGSSHQRRGGPRLAVIAPEIAADCGGQLDALVVTHRHKDHLAGFADNAAADVFRTLKPKLVVRPWTEDPEIAEGAAGPGIGRQSRALVSTLKDAETTVAAVASAIDTKARGIRGNLREYAAANISNAKAIATLDELADGKGEYLHAGSTSRLQRLVPGLKVHVLGPPTVEQWPDVVGQKARDPDYWMLHRSLWGQGRGVLGRSLRGQLVGDDDGARAQEIAAGPVRWLVDRLSSQQLHAASRVVRALDGALNNTSLILLLEVGTQRLLFPGDAQIENWSYTLTEMQRRSSLRDDLQHVSLYKVGHHGSRNATPKSLMRLWTAAGVDHPMTALMSTMPNVHGESAQTAVPRTTLVNALKRRMDVVSTVDLDSALSVEVVASCKTDSAFEVSK